MQSLMEVFNTHTPHNCCFCFSCCITAATVCHTVTDPLPPPPRPTPPPTLWPHLEHLLCCEVFVGELHLMVGHLKLTMTLQDRRQLRD
jgi:hypothetical protein